MAGHPKRPRPLGNVALAHVEDASMRASAIRHAAYDIDIASERGNHALVVMLTAGIRGEVDAIHAALRNATMGRR